MFSLAETLSCKPSSVLVANAYSLVIITVHKRLITNAHFTKVLLRFHIVSASANLASKVYESSLVSPSCLALTSGVDANAGVG